MVVDSLKQIKTTDMETIKVSISKKEIMKEAHRLYNSDFNVNKTIPFGEFLSWNWAIAKQSLYEYFRLNIKSNFIQLSHETIR